MKGIIKQGMANKHTMKQLKMDYKNKLLAYKNQKRAIINAGKAKKLDYKAQKNELKYGSKTAQTIRAVSEPITQMGGTVIGSKSAEGIAGNVTAKIQADAAMKTYNDAINGGQDVSKDVTSITEDRGSFLGG